MKKLFISFILVCFLVSNAYSMIVVYSRTFGAVADLEFGYTTIGSTPATTSLDRRIYFTTTSDMTVSYGYLYSADPLNLSCEIRIGVYNTSGVLQGTCSAWSASLTSTVQHWEVTFTPYVLPAGTYYQQYERSDETALTYYYDDVGINSAYDITSSCGTLVTTASTRKATMSIANFNAH